MIRKEVLFKENGPEYVGSLIIECDSLEQIESNVLVVNGAQIKIDEDIISINDV